MEYCGISNEIPTLCSLSLLLFKFLNFLFKKLSDNEQVLEEDLDHAIELLFKALNYAENNQAKHKILFEIDNAKFKELISSIVKVYFKQQSSPALLNKYLHLSID